MRDEAVASGDHPHTKGQGKSNPEAFVKPEHVPTTAT
jgi:hypothetical protein